MSLDRDIFEIPRAVRNLKRYLPTWSGWKQPHLLLMLLANVHDPVAADPPMRTANGSTRSRDPAGPDQAIEAAVNDVLSIFITASLLAMPPRRPDRYPGWPASFRTGPVTKLHRSRGFLA
jgi:hypothetical protein